jgi:hypothetical protein
MNLEAGTSFLYFFWQTASAGLKKISFKLQSFFYEWAL